MKPRRVFVAVPIDLPARPDLDPVEAAAFEAAVIDTVTDRLWRVARVGVKEYYRLARPGVLRAIDRRAKLWRERIDAAGADWSGPAAQAFVGRELYAEGTWHFSVVDITRRLCRVLSSRGGDAVRIEP